MRLPYPVLFALCSALFAQSGIVTTIAGGVRGFGGDGGPARLAAFTLANIRNECDPAEYEELSHLSVDAAGNIYIADSNANRIRRIALDGSIATVAGSGERPAIETSRCTVPGGAAAVGEGGSAAAAKLYGPSQALMLPSGVLLICDQKNNRIRQVTTAGTITTVVGSNLHSFFAPNVPATLSPLDWPSSIAVDASNRTVFAELHSNRIARVNADGRIQVVAGTGLPGFGVDGPDATRSALSSPVHIVFDAQGNLLVAEQRSHRIRRITPAGAISTIAGTGTPGYNGDGGRATAAQLNLPNAVAVDAAGNIYIADMGNHRVRRVGVDGVISTVAGTGQQGRGADGIAARESALNLPSSLAITKSGDLLVLDWQNYRIRLVSLAARPAVAAGGVVNAASFAGPVAAGSLISIFGTNFGGGLTQASELPLPTEIGGVSVELDGLRIPLVFVSPGQINAQVPYGVREGTGLFRVRTADGVSVEEPALIGAAAPGIFVIPGGTRAVAINQDGTLNTAANAEGRGRVLTVYMTGIGAVDGELAAGQAAPGERLFRAVLEGSATIGGRAAPLLFLGLTPGFVGLAQANVQVPEDVAAGEAVELVVRVGGRNSTPALVAVR